MECLGSDPFTDALRRWAHQVTAPVAIALLSELSTSKRIRITCPAGKLTQRFMNNSPGKAPSGLVSGQHWQIDYRTSKKAPINSLVLLLFTCIGDLKLHLLLHDGESKQNKSFEGIAQKKKKYGASETFYSGQEHIL